MLTIDHLDKCFGSTVLFRDLTFTVDGPAVLWAPSGWGKTTLLRILMGLETPTAGRVQGAGRVSAVFQEDRLCPQLTAVQNVLLVLPDDRQEAAIRQDFAWLGLDEYALALQARTSRYWVSLMSWNSSTSRCRKQVRPPVSSASARMSRSSKSSIPRSSSRAQ